VHRDLLRADPGSVFAGEAMQGESERPLGDLISPLVIEADGTVVSLGYGSGRRYGLGNLSLGRILDFVATWPRDSYPALRNLCRRVFEEETAPHDFPCFNWYEAIARRSLGSVAIMPASKDHSSVFSIGKPRLARFE